MYLRMRSCYGKRRLAAGLVFTALGGTLLAGCGGGGDNHPNPSPTATPVTTDAAGAARDVTTGQGQLNTLITAQVDPTSASLAVMSQTFASAYAKDPSNAQAAMGLAIGGIAQASQNVVNAATGISRAASSSHPLNRAQQTEVTTIQTTAQSALPWKMQRFDGNTGLKSVQTALRLPVTLSHLGHSGRAASVDVAKVRQSLVDLKTALDKAIPLVNKGADKADFAFAFPDFETNTLSPRVMDQADATSFLASLYALRGVLNIALAYDPTYGSFDFDQKISDRFAGKNTGDKITPDDYLPSAPFLVLTGSGKAGFAQAQSDFGLGALVASTALDRLGARPAITSLHLLDSQQISPADYAVAHNGINQFKTALTSPYTTTDSKHTVVNLAAWFNNPPASLRSLLPTYTVAEDTYNRYLVTDASSFPDLTFGGLIGNADTSGFKTRVYDDQTVGDLATYSGYADY